MKKIYLGDCVEIMKFIPDSSIDLICTDPPYGNMNTEGGIKIGIDKWDVTISPAVIFKEADRILRKNGKLILFSQEPYTSRLMFENLPNIKFCYRATWEKDNFANALGVNKAMVSFTEDILIFQKKECFTKNPAKEYTDKIRYFINKPNIEIYKDFESNGFNKYAVLDTFNSDNARRYNFPSKKTYENLISLYNIDKMEGFQTYESAKNEYLSAEKESTFNLWEGKKFKSNILKYKKDYDGFHPTQKPVLLLEDLIKTFSNKGDTVLDFTMGSGSTGVACDNTGRNFIGIEMDERFFKIAKSRLKISD